MNPVSCHGSMEKPNSTVVLNCWSRLVEYYFAKTIVIIKHNSKQLSSLKNYAKLIIHAIVQLQTDFIMKKTTGVSSVAKTINKFHLKSDLCLI